MVSDACRFMSYQEMQLYESILACDLPSVKALVDECKQVFALEGHRLMPEESRELLEQETRRLFGNNDKELLLIPTDRVRTRHDTSGASGCPSGDVCSYYRTVVISTLC